MQINKKEIVNKHWMSFLNTTDIVGIIETSHLKSKETKFYLGIGNGKSEISDIENILSYGVELKKEVLCNVFKNVNKGNCKVNKQLQIIRHYGYDAQVNKLKEEMTELAYARDEENFIEEIADVLNVMQGIIYNKNWEGKILKIQEYKLNRQLERIKDE